MFFFLCFVLLLSSCSKDAGIATDVPAETDPPAKAAGKTGWVPIPPEEGEFERAYGWIGNETIIYSATVAGKHALRSHNLRDGRGRELFSSTDPIIDVLTHPGGKTIFIHTAAGPHTAKIHFINAEGNTLYSTEIQSHELAYAWNESDPSSMVITAFSEDWSYEALLVDPENKKAEPVDLPQPFVKWFGRDEIVEQGWQGGEETSVPLIKRSISSLEKSDTLIGDTYRFDTSGEMLLAVRPPDGEGGELDYQFYKEGALAVSFKMKAAEEFSGWLVPDYTFTDSGRKFLTFYPAGQVPGQFQLREYHLDRGSDEPEVLFEKLEPMPLQCSEDGEACLYGYSFERLLDLKDKKEIRLDS